MKLSEKKGGDFTPHPATDAPVKGVIVDITPLKKRMTAFGEKEEFRLVYETEVEDTENDRRFCVWSRGYTPSLNEKAAFRKDIKKILGRELTKAELEEFDLEGLMGRGVKLIVQHEEKDDKVYANIAFLGADKDKPLKPSGKFVRAKDRDNAPVEEEAPAPKKQKAAAPTSWEDVVVHIGKHTGKKLGDVDPEAVTTLIEKWMPKAKSKPTAEDTILINALEEVQALLATAESPADDY